MFFGNKNIFIFFQKIYKYMKKKINPEPSIINWIASNCELGEWLHEQTGLLCSNCLREIHH